MIDNILNIVNKFIPDKNKQEEEKKQLIEAEMKANEIELETIKTNMVTLTFPILAYILAFGYLADILFQVWSGVFREETAIITIPKELKELVTTYIMFFFGSKTIQKFSDR